MAEKLGNADYNQEETWGGNYSYKINSLVSK